MTIVNDVKYFVTRKDNNFSYIGYVDVKDTDNQDYLIFHANLTERPYEEVKDKTDAEIQQMATDEANEILGMPETLAVIGNYEDILAKGRYFS